jgi:hypothetical protein|uniref:hypothetical protein n=1 Tax=Cephaloticoccus sp. TaxID=1985742 RepID=UPI004049449A
MAHRFVWLLFFVLPVLATAKPDPTLAAAHHARRMLGPDVWSKVLRIENTNPHSPYPVTVYATVFETGGILWFYNGMNGTQSLSLHHGRLAEEKQELASLLREIDPGFTRHEVLPLAVAEFARAKDELPAGCFIESVAALHDLLNRAVPIRHVRLLIYYLPFQGRVRGHTVLTYETDTGTFAIDRTRLKSPLPLSSDLKDALVVAREVELDRFGGAVERARWFTLIEPTRAGGPAYVDTQGIGVPATSTG